MALPNGVRLGCERVARRGQGPSPVQRVPTREAQTQFYISSASSASSACYARRSDGGAPGRWA